MAPGQGRVGPAAPPSLGRSRLPLQAQFRLFQNIEQVRGVPPMSCSEPGFSHPHNVLVARPPCCGCARGSLRSPRGVLCQTTTTTCSPVPSLRDLGTAPGFGARGLGSYKYSGTVSP